MAEVKLKNVKKVYKDVVAVEDVNIEVKNREFVILVGPSGSGKSTILRMIAGLEEISEGEIYIDGKIVNEIPAKDRDIAMVFQNYALYPHMNVYENMGFALRLRKFPGEEIERRVKEAAKILGIENLLSRYPKELSGGQKQRVAIGRAIVRKPKVFLFDEPLSNLDAKMRVQMRIELIQLHKRLNSTVIYVTHDQIEAMTMGDKIVVLKDGRVQQIGDAISLYENPVNKFVAGFIGSPSMNFIEGTIRKEREIYFLSDNIKVKIDIKKFSVIEKVLNKKVILGIRPEDIVISEKGDIEGIIEASEVLGNEVIHHIKADEKNIVAREKGMVKRKFGEKINLVFPPEKIHIFDKESEKNLEFYPA